VSTQDRLSIGFLALGGIFLVLIIIVVGNDAGSPTEVGFLQGTSVSTPCTTP
jgi:hypothetical protein